MADEKEKKDGFVEEYAENEKEYRDDNVKDTEDVGSYTADDIQVLEGLQAVRKRPGMYIGTTSSRGLHHLVYEIVDNSVDEALAGFCTHIEVSINPGESVTVTDDGRGIPVGINHKTGKSAVEVVYTILHAGGKFGGGGYKVSGGLHGVGASVVNALSTWLEVTVRQEGKIYQIRFENGGHVAEKLHQIGTCDIHNTGTSVTFQPDPEIFQETTVYDYEVVKQRLREMAFLTKGLKITLRDLRPENALEDGSPRTDVFHYEGGGPMFSTMKAVSRNMSRTLTAARRLCITIFCILTARRTMSTWKLRCSTTTPIMCRNTALSIISIRRKAACTWSASITRSRRHLMTMRGRQIFSAKQTAT